jgi:hypothetical protein
MDRDALMGVAPLVVEAAKRAGRMWPVTATDNIRAELFGGVRVEAR